MSDAGPRFDFYQEVLVCTNEAERLRLNGKVGVVLGRSNSEDGKIWYYVLSFKDEPETWYFGEGELEPTGKWFSREDFYDGSSVRVRVDEKGRGSIVDEDEQD